MNMIQKLIIFFAGVLLAVSSAADVKTFVRDYTYNASETDSKVSARQSALQQLQSIVIQEVGVQVQSSFATQENLSNEEFSRQVQANYQTFARALTKTQILKEEWNGETFYIKARIEVDTDSVIDGLKVVFVKSAPASTPVQADPCKAVETQVFKLLDDIRTDENLNAIIALSKQHGFDRACNNWQYSILSNFTSNLTHSDAYRAHLFSRIQNEESDKMAGYLLIEVLRYALVIQPLSYPEWTVVRDAIYRGEQSTTFSLIELLFKHTKTPLAADANKHLVERNARKQEVKALEEQMMDLTLAAAQLNLSFNDPLDELTVAEHITRHGLNRQPATGRRYYFEYLEKFDKEAVRRLTKPVLDYYNEQPSADAYQLLFNHFYTVDVDGHTAKLLFRQLEKMQDHPTYLPGFLKSDYDLMVKEKFKSFEKIILQARTSERNKVLWMITLGLPHESVCTVEACAKQLFSKNQREVEDAAEFLMAYGKRAAAAQADVIKKLSRLKALNKVSNDTRVIPKLLQALSRMQSYHKDMIPLMVWALADVDKRINESASKSLQLVGVDGFTDLVNLYPTQNPTTQRRIVEVMGSYQRDQAYVVKFLASIKPASPQIQFAIEDAMVALNASH